MHFMHTQCMETVFVHEECGNVGAGGEPARPGGRNVQLRAALVAAAQVAANQYGAITRRQLLQCGLGERQTERRVTDGRLQIVARGVYTIAGTANTWERRLMCAYLFTLNRANPGIVSHESAGVIYGLANCTTTQGIVLSTDASDRHPNPLAAMYRCSDLLPEDVVIGFLGIPTTSPARTVLDLATASTREAVIAAIVADAVELGVVTLAEVIERVEKSSHRAGIATVRKVVRRMVRQDRLRQRELEHLAGVLERRANRRAARELASLELVDQHEKTEAA
jgi:hypothetical protein